MKIGKIIREYRYKIKAFYLIKTICDKKNLKVKKKLAYIEKFKISLDQSFFKINKIFLKDKNMAFYLLKLFSFKRSGENLKISHIKSLKTKLKKKKKNIMKKKKFSFIKKNSKHKSKNKIRKKNEENLKTQNSFDSESFYKNENKILEKNIKQTEKYIINFIDSINNHLN